MSYARERFDREAALNSRCIDNLSHVLETLVENLAPSREKSVAITKLDEFRMWANAAIAYDVKMRCMR